MSEAALHFEQVTRRFGKKTAVDRLDLKVEPGSILGLVGRNGSGKTTSLCLAYGLLYADEGSIRVLGLEPAAGRPRIAHPGQPAGGGVVAVPMDDGAGDS